MFSAPDFDGVVGGGGGVLGGSSRQPERTDVNHALGVSSLM